MPRDETTLAEMILAARRIGEFTNGLDDAGFLVAAKTWSAVCYQLVILGEAARRPSVDFRDRHPAIAWRQMIGMRNRLIQIFNRVDLDIVWDTVRAAVPLLLAYVEPLLSPAA